MKKTMTLVNYLRAGYPLLWIETFEEQRAIEDYKQQIVNNELTSDYTIFSFDVVTGLKNHNDNSVNDIDEPNELLQTIATLPENSIIFCLDFHKFIDDLMVYRNIKSIIPDLKAFSKHLVFISPTVKIPLELQKDITVIDYNLPSVNELMTVAQKLVTDNKLDIEVKENVIMNAKGLTLAEAQNSFSRSIIESGNYDDKILQSEKLQAVKKSGFMEIYEPMPLDTLGGLKTGVDYVTNRKKGFFDDNLPTPKGILLTGIAGSGKSYFSKIVSSILGFPLLYLNLANAKGSLVGQSQENLNTITQLIDSVSPVVILLDEIEKALSGAGSGASDGGTTDNLVGSLLNWMQESTSQHYIIATCNDIQALFKISDGAFIRRFDDTFFIGLPSKNERIEIIDIMQKRYNVDVKNVDNLANETKGYTGAEIEKVIKNSCFDGLETALKNVKPLSIQSKDIVTNQIKWAQNNAIIANEIEEQTEKRNIKL